MRCCAPDMKPTLAMEACILHGNYCTALNGPARWCYPPRLPYIIIYLCPLKDPGRASAVDVPVKPDERGDNFLFVCISKVPI